VQTKKEKASFEKEIVVYSPEEKLERYKQRLHNDRLINKRMFSPYLDQFLSQRDITVAVK